MRSFILIFSLLFSTALFSTASTAADSGNANIKAIRSHAASLLRNHRIDAVRPSPIPGLFEVQSGRSIFYSNADGSYFVLGGHIIDTITKKDLTRARQEELNRVAWSVLPLDKAIISGDRHSKLKLAVFTDPECPYCRKFEKTLAKVRGVKVYSFLYPLSFHKHAKRWATAIWCSKNRQKTMIDVMLNDANPAAGTCNTPIAGIAALGKKLGISGTPTLISGDGRISAGGKSAAELKAWLQEQ